MTENAAKLAPVGKYEERPLKDALAKPADIEKAESRPQVDQIEDYHKKNPTLKKTPDADTLAALQEKQAQKDAKAQQDANKD